ncbi:MAG TPA: L-2-hydroxyglutarate oxidase [Gaiellaceae bacterium]|nr:L-2-hydroxyglutarate oxidase [Gaiellaceae bacterium]
MDADVIVVGGGILGLASALELLERSPGLRLTLLEKEPAPAVHQTGHNSGVVHAGLYYAPGSLKATLCREGRGLLERFCREHHIPVEHRGKLVVAADDSELERLAELKRRGTGNGLEGLAELGEAEMREIEPHVRGVRGLHVPETGVVDFGLVAERMIDVLRSRGTQVELGCRVEQIERDGEGLAVATTRGRLRADALVACAGLQADRVAALAGADVGVRVIPFRGAYWVLRGAGAALVRGLIYPVPDPAFPFLGVHFTRRIDGAVWAGPNAMPAFAREGYSRRSFSPGDAAEVVTWPGLLRFAARYGRMGATEVWRDLVKPAAVREMQRYLPALRGCDVVRGPSGIRAQVMTRSGELIDDFHFAEGPRSLHVINAPSPGATSSLAIGRLVAERAAKQFGL